MAAVRKDEAKLTENPASLNSKRFFPFDKKATGVFFHNLLVIFPMAYRMCYVMLFHSTAQGVNGVTVKHGKKDSPRSCFSRGLPSGSLSRVGLNNLKSSNMREREKVHKRTWCGGPS